MGAVAPAIFYAIFIWWFATGLVLLLVLRQRWLRGSLLGTLLFFPILLYLASKSAESDSVLGVYSAFTAAVLLWGTQEIAFLTGFLTGPKPMPCPRDARGWARFKAAIGAILYHELALAVTGLALAYVTWGETNQIGGLTYLVLWTMRVSAKVNLYLGVPVLNDEVLPERIQFLRSYFRRAPVNGLFPLCVVASSLLTGYFVAAASGEFADRATEAGYTLLAVLTVLAIVEHVFMLLPLPIDRLWRWSTGRSVDRSRACPALTDLEGGPEPGLPARS